MARFSRINTVKMEIFIKGARGNRVSQEHLIVSSAIRFFPKVNDRLIHVGETTIVLHDIELGRAVGIGIPDEPKGRPEPWTFREFGLHLEIAELLGKSASIMVR
jgi:hypothetical protein